MPKKTFRLYMESRQPPAQHRTEQLHALTGLRGLAAIGIVLHHYTAYLFPATGNAVQQFTPFLLKNYLWVDFFFILSGFVLVHVYQQTFTSQVNRKDYFTFIRARLAHIYPLHLVTLGFLICLELARLYIFQTYGIGDLQHPPFTGKHSIESIFSNIFLLQTFHEWSYWNEPAWAISAEWLLYLVVPLLIFLSQYSNRLLKTGVILFGFLALFLLASRNNGLDFCTWRALIRCSAEVTIGILSYQLSFQLALVNRLKKPWITSLLLAGALLTLALPINHVITVTIFILLICFAAQLPTHPLLTHRFVVFLGTISYSIYMVHWCVRDVLQMLSFSLTGQNFNANISTVQQGWMLCVVITATVGVSVCCYVWVEQPLRIRIAAKHKK